MASAAGTQSDARFETSAAMAEVEASTTRLSQDVEHNAQKLHNAAEDAAHHAHFKTPESAVDQLERGLSHQTEAAAAEGQSNIESAKAAGVGYVEQVKNLAGSALATAQSYLPGSTTTTTTARDTLNTGAGSVQSAAGAAIATAKDYSYSAMNAAQPVAAQVVVAGQTALDNAKTMAAPYIESAKAKLQGGAPMTPSNTSGEETAPLESGPRVVREPYQAPPTTQGTKVGGL